MCILHTQIEKTSLPGHKRNKNRDQKEGKVRVSEKEREKERKKRQELKTKSKVQAGICQWGRLLRWLTEWIRGWRQTALLKLHKQPTGSARTCVCSGKLNLPGRRRRIRGENWREGLRWLHRTIKWTNMPKNGPWASMSIYKTKTRRSIFIHTVSVAWPMVRGIFTDKGERVFWSTLS